MTPAEIRDKRFDKGMGGYKTEEVHHFLNQVADYVAALEGDKNEMLDKMEILADKLEQYREDEESLRAALIGAQKLGNSVVRESQRKAEAIIAQAVRKAEDIVNDAQQNIDSEALALKKMQRDVAGFKEKIIKLYSEHLEMIQRLPDDTTLPDVEVAQINYQPPAVDQVSEELDLPVGGRGESAGEEEFQLEFAPVGGEESNTEHIELNYDEESGGDAGESGTLRKNRKGFEQLGQFFGEDKPIERK